MTGQLEQLLDEFVGCWARDEPLAVDELLSRASPEADELALLIDRFLERAPRREPTADALAFVRSLDDPPLLRARQARKLKLDDLVGGLVETLGLGEGARAKVRRYYQELELGQLDPAGVAVSVWVALAGLLGRDAKGLTGVQPTAISAPAMYREAHFETPDAVLLDAITLPSPSSEAAPEPDDVDRLFGVTSAD